MWAPALFVATHENYVCEQLRCTYVTALTSVAELDLPVSRDPADYPSWYNAKNRGIDGEPASPVEKGRDPHMLIDVATLPTPIAEVAARLNVVGPDSSADTFLITSYLAEVGVKAVAVALHAALREKAPDYAYRIGYELVRADGLGSWEKVIRSATTLPQASYLGGEFGPVLEWATRKRTKAEDEWFREARTAAGNVLFELGVELEISRQDSVRTLISALVQIRNKTKAHGAAGQDFFSAVNPYYIKAVTYFVQNCPLLSWEWMHLSKREAKGTVRGVLLTGTTPRYMKDAEVAGLDPKLPGIYIASAQARRPYFAGDLLRTNLECSKFFLPNGAMTERGDAETIDYGSGELRKDDFSSFARVPAPLPRSETHGLENLDIQSNILGNLPPLSPSYIQRPKLEEELQARLSDKNHAIITLHGSGGVGKTFLALAGAHRIAESSSPRFESVIWFSGRDVDLRPSGPISVRPSVLKLEDISSKYGGLFGRPETLEYFASALEGLTDNSGKGILFVFDNFETMENVRELHRFLDTHTHLPNKVLITSRERAFKADYPIEVKGMEKAEALEMLAAGARDLGIEPIVTNAVAESIYEFTKGHAYVMRVVLGEIAKERRYVPPSQIMSARLDIVSAIFERSFSKLTDDGRSVFLTVANWKSRIPELALLVVLGQRRIDVEAGIDECRRLSLITVGELEDGQPCYSAPQLARVFGKKKLEGDPDRLVIQEDIETLQRFGVASENGSHETQERLILRFVSWCSEEAVAGDANRVSRLDAMLETLACLWPQGWMHLARFRKQTGSSVDLIDQALRRAVEEQPDNKEVWLERARFAEETGNEPTRVASLVSAVEADPRDSELVREVAFQLCRYVNEHRIDIPVARRGVYLASVRSHMEKVADQLDATGLSRLAWLFLLEGNEQMGRFYAEMGLKKDSDNEYCIKILDRPRSRGQGDLF